MSTRTGDDADSGRGLLGRQRNVLLEATEIEIWLVLPEGEGGCSASSMNRRSHHNVWGPYRPVAPSEYLQDPTSNVSAHCVGFCVGVASDGGREFGITPGQVQNY